jgi:TetR/AcrR family transcriptional regulator, transcriptional repressor of bet genes
MPKIVDPIAQRKMITAAAIAVIHEKGIDGAKLRDVARAANVTTGTIMHYFESKESVLAAVLSEIADRTIERMQKAKLEGKPLTVQVFINEAIYQLPINDENRVEWRVWLAFCGSAIGNQALLHLHRRHYRKIVSRVMILLHRLRCGAPANGNHNSEPREPVRFSFRDGTAAVLAVPEALIPGQPMKLVYPRQVHRCAEAVVAAIEGIGSRASLDPERWPLWCQAETLVETLTPMLNEFIRVETEKNNGYMKITRLAA